MLCEGDFTVCPFAARMSSVIPRTFAILSVIKLLFSAGNLFAGGSGLNVVVVVNQDSTNSVQLGNYYCEQRQVPPQNVLRVNWTGGNISWDEANFESVLLNPFRTMVSSRGLTNQIDFVVLSMDLPFQVGGNGGVNSTTSALFYGFKPDGCTTNCPEGIPSCNLPGNSANAYAGSEDIFRNVAPGTGSTNFLAVMLTSDSLANAKLVVDHGVMSDGTFPTQTVLLAKSSDTARNVRYQNFDDTVFNTRIRGNYPVMRVNSDSPLGQTNLLGYENGLYQFTISSDAFVPGAMADSLTSFGGIIFGPNDHTTSLAFLNAGAIGSYGTVVEPCNYLEKFPSSQNYFYQARGFSLAESYYQSLQNPYQGLLLGEPLAAPFALPASASWSNLTANALLTGTTNLSVRFMAGGAQHPVQQVDLFLDGIWMQTLTNLAPCPLNELYVTINGNSTNYTVAASATIKSVARNLTDVLNSLFTNATEVQAFNYGDRIELRSFDSNTLGAQISLSVSNSIGATNVLNTYISASRTNFLDSIAWGNRGYLIAGTVVSNDYFQLTAIKTNGIIVTVGVTNLGDGVSLTSFVQQFLNAINAAGSLQGSDGLVAEDFLTDSSVNGSYVTFNFRARGQGFAAAQIQAAIAGDFSYSVTGTNRLNENLSDLQPRNHLYITAGATNLAFSFGLNTTAYADGYHELTAVAYEGSHVRTQKRVSQNVRIQNSPLSATFNSLLGDSNTAIEATMQFSVTANTNSSAISKIELFSTGGSLGSVLSQSNAVFSIAGTNLDLGLHPFYAMVTRSDGWQYRTETKWIRLVAATPAFSLTFTNPPPAITWSAVAGRSYEVLSTTNITGTFQVRDTVTPTNSTGLWVETNSAPSKQYYRVRVSP